MNPYIRILVLLCTALSAQAALACSIVYGKDWAYAVEPPPGWSSACHDSAAPGTTITLWPSSSSPQAADALIYVTVSTKGQQTLQEFASDALKRFKDAAPAARSRAFTDKTPELKFNVTWIALSGAPPGTREELVAYIEGPTAFFIAVVSAESADVLAKRRADFIAFVSKFIPMERR